MIRKFVMICLILSEFQSLQINCSNFFNIQYYANFSKKKIHFNFFVNYILQKIKNKKDRKI